MADLEQTDVDIEVITKALEQKFGDNIAATGVAPSLSGEAFTPHHSEADGILRYKEPAVPANDEADLGGLFTFAHLQPALLEWVMMDLGASVAYTVSIVTSAGDWQVASGTSQFVILTPRAPLMPGENIKVTFAAPGVGNKGWVRVYVRSDQSRH
jgi:hypothetical protein